MKDNITFSKIWEDGDIIELKVVCSSSVATITSQIYVSDSLIDELICQIKQFLDGNIEEGLWANEDKGNDSTACVSLRFLRKDKLGISISKCLQNSTMEETSLNTIVAFLLVLNMVY